VAGLQTCAGDGRYGVAIGTAGRWRSRGLIGPSLPDQADRCGRVPRARCCSRGSRRCQSDSSLAGDAGGPGHGAPSMKCEVASAKCQVGKK
jgi:hypothetical protein